MLRRWWLIVVGIVLGGSCWAQSPPPARAAAPRSLDQAVHARIGSILKVLSDNGDWNQSLDQARRVFDMVIRQAPTSDAALFADAAATVRLLDQLAKVPDPERRALLQFFQQNRALAREMVFTVRTEDDAREAYAILARLRAAYGDRVAALPALAAAICVVHDRPHYAKATRTEKSPGERIDPVALFGFYARNEQRMLFGLNSLPPEALVYLVNTTASIDELEWALGRHAGDRNVGKRYNDLVYDTANFKYNKPKKIDSVPYSLQNIARLGGVCEEQAYYAAHVARAIGVPAAVIEGQSSDDAHAWVGFLQMRGSSLAWNMDEGHYDEYEQLRGHTGDPQTGGGIDDDRLAFTALAYSRPPEARHGAVALVDAARRIARLRSGSPALPVEPGLEGSLPTPRAFDGAAQLLLVEAALALCPCSVVAWDGVAESAKVMNEKDRTRWFELLTTQCGQEHAGFAYGIIAAMAAAVPSPADQSRVWDWVFSRYRQLPDLAGGARIRQGMMWEKAGDKGRAYEAYVDVSRQFPNDGTKAVDALQLAERLLGASKKDSAIVEMYKDAWRRMSRPSTTSSWAFRSSNFYRVGTRYAKALEKVGLGAEAENVRRQLKAGEDKDHK